MGQCRLGSCSLRRTLCQRQPILILHGKLLERIDGFELDQVFRIDLRVVEDDEDVFGLVGAGIEEAL